MTDMILIASSSFDVDTHQPVCKRLAELGADLLVYETDRAIRGEQAFSITIAEDGRLEISCDGVDISPDRVSAAWLWKVASFRNADAEHNVSKQLSMVNEMVLWNNTIWTLYPEHVWLNSPTHTAAADRKLLQLQVARQVGFSIPQTIVSSTWDPIASALFDDASGDKAVVKMLRGVIADQNAVKAMYTEVLTQQRLNALRAVAHPFPGMYQPFIPKAREWRVTVVGDRCFPVAIYTDDDAKDDWRRRQLTPSVRFVREPMPESAEERCRAFLREFSLRYGAFDLVERPDGELIFLECNPSGQHNWLEEAVGIPVADAIADELLSIARRS